MIKTCSRCIYAEMCEGREQHPCQYFVPDDEDDLIDHMIEYNRECYRKAWDSYSREDTFCFGYTDKIK